MGTSQVVGRVLAGLVIENNSVAVFQSAGFGDEKGP